jgi:carnitine O-acetyltransferase
VCVSRSGQSFDARRLQPATRYSLLSKATKAHNTYTKEASTGRGIDRHFLGLRLLLREGESHPLLDDPLFAKSQEWVLSTSGLSAGDRFHGTGFGAVYPNGYGINCELLASRSQLVHSN